MLAFTLALSGCSGGGSPAATGTPSSGKTVTPVATGNTTLDSALNSTSDVRTALVKERKLTKEIEQQLAAAIQGFQAQFQPPAAARV